MYFYNPPALFWGLWEASKTVLPPVVRGAPPHGRGAGGSYLPPADAQHCSRHS